MKLLPPLIIICVVLTGSAQTQSFHSFSYVDVLGDERSTSEFEGKYLLVDFFATWCGPCIAGIPKLQTVKAYRGDVISLFTLSSSPSTDTPEVMEQFVTDYNVTWDVGIDSNLTITNAYGVQYIPTFMIISPEGELLSLFNASEASSAYDIVKKIDEFVPNSHTNFPDVVTALQVSRSPVGVTILVPSASLLFLLISKRGLKR